MGYPERWSDGPQYIYIYIYIRHKRAWQKNFADNSVPVALLLLLRIRPCLAGPWKSERRLSIHYSVCLRGSENTP